MSGLSFSYNPRSLPRDPKEYATKEFWENFHHAETKFEWYGNIADHYDILEKNILKPGQHILNVGCGTSKMEFELATIGYPNIHSIDIDSSVIKKKQHIARNFPGLRFDVASVDNIPAEDGTYDVILDKGTMDALLPVDGMDGNSTKLVDDMLNECFRVLKERGYYVIISLGQVQVIRKLYEYTQEHLDIMVNVTANEVYHNNSYFPAVIIAMLKLPKPMPRQMPWRLAETPNGVPSPRTLDELHEFFNSQYNFARFGNMCKRKLDHIASILISLIDDKDETVEAKITVIDDQDRKRICKHSFVIVPPDSENGVYNRSLAHYRDVPVFMKSDRVIMCEFPFDDDGHSRRLIDSFSARFLSFDCDGKTNICKMVPEERSTEIFAGEGKIVGKFSISQCTIGDTTYRRLFFDSTPNIIQSECIVEEDGMKPDAKNPLKICVGYQLAMMGALELVPGGFFDLNKRAWRIAVIGVGGGSLVTFLYHALNKSTITCVEIEAELYNIATNYFGMPSDEERVIQLVEDGIQWLANDENGKYDLLFVDVSGPDEKQENDETLGPPPEFVKSSVLLNYKKRLSHRGCLIMNIISASYDYCSKIMLKMAPHFKYIFEASVYEGACSTNYILFATNEKPNRLPPRMEKKVPDHFKPLIKHGKLFSRFNVMIPPHEVRKPKPSRRGSGDYKQSSEEDELHTAVEYDEEEYMNYLRSNEVSPIAAINEEGIVGCDPSINNYGYEPEIVDTISNFKKVVSRKQRKVQTCVSPDPISTNGSNCVAGFHYVTCNNYEDDVASYRNPDAIHINVVIP